MHHLGNLSPAPGSHRSRKRLGRGVGSGTGKTAGKGHKGQKARKSGGTRPGFEGGQTPLYRRVPKRGFTGKNPKTSTTVSLSQLSSFGSGELVTIDSLVAKGIISSSKSRSTKVKLLGGSELEHPLNIEVHKCSDGAMKAVEKAGGSVKIISSESSSPTKE